MKFRNLLIEFLIFLFFLFAFSTTIKAANSNGFTELKKSPRKYFSVSSNTLSDITMTVVCDTKINSVKCYTIDSTGSNKKEINIPVNTSNKKNYIYTLSHNDLLKGTTNNFYLEITDENGNIHYSGFKISPKNKIFNNEKVEYYEIDDSPRIKFYSVANKQLSFVLKDLDGIKSFKVQDVNNSNKEIYSLTDFSKGDSNVSLDLEKFSASNGVYKLKFISQEDTSGYAQKSTQIISFKPSEKAMIVTDTSKKYDFSFDKITFSKVATFDTGAQYNYIQAMDYYNGNYYISTYNYLSSSHRNSLLKFDSKFSLVKSAKNILEGYKVTGVVCSANGNDLFLSCNQTNKVRVYNPSTLKSEKISTIANIGTVTNAMSYDRKNKRYALKSGNIKYFFVVDGTTGKVIKKIPRKSGSDLGQDICISGDYILELQCKTSAVDIYSISKGKYIRSDSIKYNGNVKFGSNFEPEGICQISDNEFIIGVASSDIQKKHMCILFYKGTLKELTK